MNACGDFSELTPDVLLEAVETATGRRLTGFAQPHTSYINRVYELQASDGERLIAKFYRPGRWSREAILEEHAFTLELAAEEVPVVPPRPLRDGGTLGDAGGIPFAVFEKRRGREFEPAEPEDWRRLGRLLGRLHSVGERSPAPARVVLHPDRSTRADLELLRAESLLPAAVRRPFLEAADELHRRILPLFADVELLRIHGDCHRQNILERPEEGLLLIDFDDMATGPAVQDLWMLLPDRPERARAEIDRILEGYETFREFDDRHLRLIEPLRAMRMLYFLAWCARQTDDPQFARRFPDWGGESFWRQQTADLREQLDILR
ncbi:MAG: serine/threonine protein kinase [Lentisphaeria bacterium]|jgi:Ser/Thr protein kinase RdoA (MazF antagonist)|nr:serine/threonine protein kinase [Lentisphaeria bacterium]